MPLSMHQASAPAFVRQLRALSALLEKGAAFAETKGMAPAELLQARLTADMHPLVRQVQIAADMAKSAMARLAEIEVPSHPDEETTFPELQQRIAKTIAFIESVPAEKVDGGEDRTITLKVGPNTMDFQAQPYLVLFALPNFYFHASMTYALLRQAGVEIGKRDFLGGL